MTQDTSAEDMPRPRVIEGTAMLTMLTSSRVMKPATMHSTSAGQRTGSPLPPWPPGVFFIETPHFSGRIRGASTCVGDQTRAFHARHGALLVVLRTIAADPDRAEQRALGVADQYAAARGGDAPLGDGGQRGEEGRV